MSDTVTAFLGLGSNIGDKRANLDYATERLAEIEGIEVEKVSSYCETAPVGYAEQPNFLNAVVRIKTVLTPHQLLDVCLQIEQELKRIRTIKWGPRTMDIDILLFDDLVIDDERLIIPHPYMHERGFVLEPLCEIVSEETLHPIYKKTIREMLMDLEKSF